LVLIDTRDMKLDMSQSSFFDRVTCDDSKTEEEDSDLFDL